MTRADRDTPTRIHAIGWGRYPYISFISFHSPQQTTASFTNNVRLVLRILIVLLLPIAVYVFVVCDVDVGEGQEQGTQAAGSVKCLLLQEIRNS